MRLSRSFFRCLVVVLLGALVSGASIGRLSAEDTAPPRPDGPAFLPWQEEVAPADDAEAGAGQPAPTTPFDPARLALMPELRVGIVMDPAAGDFGRAAPFRELLEAGLRLPVLLIAYRDLSQLQKAVMTGEVHYAPLSASAYAAAQGECGCLEPLVAPREADGGTGWHAIVLARAGEGIDGPADVAGRRIATGPREAVGSRLVQLAGLSAAGVDLEGQAADALIAHDDPLSAALALVRGDADVAFAWSSLQGEAAAGYSRGTLRDLAERGIEISGLRIVWASGAIAGAPHVVRRDVPQEIRSEISAIMTGQGAAQTASGAGFVAVGAEDYAPVLAAFPPDAGAPRGRLRPLGGGD
ncbi:phosphate/phosphite/phosphonate ABC transporter substrate-binding protein [Stappia indica]|uniref:Phosphonate transport system substrate-binding protein n=1 Tax=Stappia indica TaxID=538381 RepID=A0A285T901_9HYPH|nr:PhnD/SsuA/transferrin family substrate-binding protein [Stappia indica]SOC17625.1 phosphonate transport system substrate-binding protein [Stappia indica]